MLEDSVVSYKCGEVFYGEGDAGIMYNDPDMAIEWPFDKIGGIEKLIISDKDKNLPFTKCWRIRAKIYDYVIHMATYTTNKLGLLFNKLEVHRTNYTLFTNGIEHLFKFMIYTILLKCINILILYKATTFVFGIEGSYLICPLHIKSLEFKFLYHD